MRTDAGQTNFEAEIAAANADAEGGRFAWLA